MEGGIERAFDLLADPAAYPRWWHGAGLRAQELSRGDEDGTGRTVDFEVRGFLPYVLRWRLCCTETKRPIKIVAEAEGDLEGRGTWFLRQAGCLVEITFEWKVRLQKPFLREAAFIFRPLLIWNHNRVMQTWETSLRHALENTGDSTKPLRQHVLPG